MNESKIQAGTHAQTLHSRFINALRFPPWDHKFKESKYYNLFNLNQMIF
ncbi:hypothetical protein LEP1GSC021_2316 [Leptospira noguchii str. 1993005606]|uniref:Uncharacterized protein n=1 Tax=Leptospira noguchii str. 2007001578 TaxID=1049974 RepID=A0ABN0J5B5_9LEPT|nr:hypothetical protein LEP1GSC035_2766 [Leptospira noguchii str. 2007001578]EPE85209.1 hypothetical protein LEP1GSC021_2316 [Leptospira noguchii str. 1993005606]